MYHYEFTLFEIMKVGLDDLMYDKNQHVTECYRDSGLEGFFRTT